MVLKGLKTISLVFLSDYCFIQDLTCWKMIGLGKLHSNLYLLQTLENCKSISEATTVLESVLQSFVHSVSHVPIVTKPYLWHLRLGHVSDDKLHHCISDVSSFHFNKECVVCLLQSIKDCLFLILNTCLIMLLI